MTRHGRWMRGELISIRDDGWAVELTLDDDLLAWRARAPGRSAKEWTRSITGRVPTWSCAADAETWVDSRGFLGSDWERVATPEELRKLADILDWVTP